MIYPDRVIITYDEEGNQVKSYLPVTNEWVLAYKQNRMLLTVDQGTIVLGGSCTVTVQRTTPILVDGTQSIAGGAESVPIIVADEGAFVVELDENGTGTLLLTGGRVGAYVIYSDPFVYASNSLTVTVTEA